MQNKTKKQRQRCKETRKRKVASRSKYGGKSFRKTNRKTRRNTNIKTQEKVEKVNKTNINRRFFNGGAYPSGPYEMADYRLDPQRQIVDSRLLPTIQGGKRNNKSIRQKGGFYGVDVLKTASSIYPYPLSNLTGMTELPAASRLLSSEQISNNDTTVYKEKYLV